MSDELFAFGPGVNELYLTFYRPKMLRDIYFEFEIVFVS
jgi:hypothetical protein